jgi:hypothetical protein
MDVKLIAGTLPADYCLEDLQAFYNLMFAQAYGVLETTASIAKVIVSTTEPSVDQHDFIWIRINPATGIYDKIYNFRNGKWVSPYRVPAGSPEHILWFDTAAKLKVYDGGVDEVVGLDGATGPFWVEDTAAAAKFLMGAGTLPSTKVVNVLDVGGLETQILTRAKLPKEKLKVLLPLIGHDTVGTLGQPVAGNDYGSTPRAGIGRALEGTETDLDNRYHPKGETEEELGSDEPLNMLPPYLGVIFAKRTARQYWVPA